MIRYLKRIIRIKLTLRQIANSKDLPLYNSVSYIDNNFAKGPKDYKLIMKYYFFFNNIIVLEYSKK